MTGQQESDYSRVCGDDDEEIARRARVEGRVDVVFPGSVTQDGCCRFVCELFKCVLYQRRQLPMSYDQMVFFQKQQLTTTQVRQTDRGHIKNVTNKLNSAVVQVYSIIIIIMRIVTWTYGGCHYKSMLCKIRSAGLTVIKPGLTGCFQSTKSHFLLLTGHLVFTYVI